jgi:hypothetical protein
MSDKSQLSSPMKPVFPTPGPNPGGGTFGKHTSEGLTKPADKGVLDLKFFTDDNPSPATTSSPMTVAPAGIGFKK